MINFLWTSNEIIVISSKLKSLNTPSLSRINGKSILLPDVNPLNCFSIIRTFFSEIDSVGSFSIVRTPINDFSIPLALTASIKFVNDVRQRVASIVKEVTARYEGTVILVAHRVVNKVLICALLGLDNSHFWNIRQDNCGITTFNYDNGRFVLTEHNNTSFLAPLQKAPLSDF